MIDLRGAIGFPALRGEAEEENLIVTVFDRLIACEIHHVSTYRNKVIQNNFCTTFKE